MEPSEARILLIAQHDHLRVLLADAEALARRFLAGEPTSAELDAALGEVRAAFDLHNRFEASLLEPILRTTGEAGGRRVERMIEEHTEEHQVFAAFLARPVVEVAPELPDFVEEIVAHMEAEERTFLSPKMLRDAR